MLKRKNSRKEVGTWIFARQSELKTVCVNSLIQLMEMIRFGSLLFSPFCKSPSKRWRRKQVELQSKVEQSKHLYGRAKALFGSKWTCWQDLCRFVFGYENRKLFSRFLFVLSNCKCNFCNSFHISHLIRRRLKWRFFGGRNKGRKARRRRRTVSFVIEWKWKKFESRRQATRSN